MTPVHVNSFREMKYRGLARSDAECGRMLGVTLDTVSRGKARGFDDGIRTALACAALLRGLTPYEPEVAATPPPESGRGTPPAPV